MCFTFDPFSTSGIAAPCTTATAGGDVAPLPQKNNAAVLKPRGGGMKRLPRDLASAVLQSKKTKDVGYYCCVGDDYYC